MPEVICNTSPLQYLYQLDLLSVLQTLVAYIIVPPAVVQELAVGRAQGVRQPVSAPALPLITDLGPGETEVLALALEAPDAVVLLDDALARRVATTLHIRFRGTLGLLLDAKRAGAVSSITPLLEQLHALRFHLSPRTRDLILALAGEAP